MEPGLGESNWGYMGVRVSGNNNIVRENRLETIGYIGISVESNTGWSATVQQPWPCSTMAAVSAWTPTGRSSRQHHRDITGNLESAPNSGVLAHRLRHLLATCPCRTPSSAGSIANCSGGGMHVDHTMLSQGNRSSTTCSSTTRSDHLIDFSNSQDPVPGAFSMPSYNQTISGNVFHILTSSACTNSGVDTGLVRPTFATTASSIPTTTRASTSRTRTSTRRCFTLARWQAEQAERPVPHQVLCTMTLRGDQRDRRQPRERRSTTT